MEVLLEIGAVIWGLIGIIAAADAMEPPRTWLFYALFGPFAFAMLKEKG